MVEIVSDSNSRLVYLKGEGNIQKAYPSDNYPYIRKKPSLDVENGMCAYLIRLELAPEGHPEVGAGFNLKVIDRMVDVYRKGGDKISFDDLVSECSDFPNCRGENNYPVNMSEIDKLFPGLICNLNVLILSEFSGYWNGYGPHFNEIETYLPVIEEALDEFANSDNACKELVASYNS